MRKVLVSLAAVSAAFVAVPAAAQGYYGQGYGQGYGQAGYYGQGYRGDRGLVRQFDGQIAQLQQRIERSARRGAISGGEYRSLINQAQNIRHRLHRFARNGLDRGEANSIAARIQDLRHRIREERQDGRRYNNRGW